MDKKQIVFNYDGKIVTVKTTDPNFLFEDSNIVEYKTVEENKVHKKENYSLSNHISLKEFDKKDKLTKSEEKVQ